MASTKASAKPKLLVVDMGTFCDNRLMDDALRHARPDYDMVYVTDKKRKLPRNTDEALVYRFETPTDVTGTSASADADIELDILDSQRTAIGWGLVNPSKAYHAYTWVSTMASLVADALRDHAPQGIVIHYAATMLLWWVPVEVLAKHKVFIIYHAPGLISRDVPWVFDRAMKDPSFTLYATSPAYRAQCTASWHAYYNKLAMTTLAPAQLRAKLARIHHIMCWDPTVTPAIRPAFSGMHVHQPGALYTQRYASKRWYSPGNAATSGNRALATWLKAAPTVLVTFGSYSAAQAMSRLLPLMLRALEECGTRVLYHNVTSTTTISETPLRKVHQGWLPYEWVVPRCAAVMFTGSVCLQTVCAFNATPMIYVPLLSEQFFWARNYQAMTGTSYVKYTSADDAVVTDLLKAWLVDSRTARTRDYLKKCAASMRKHDGSKGVSEVLKAVLQKHRNVVMNV